MGTNEQLLTDFPISRGPDRTYENVVARKANMNIDLETRLIIFEETSEQLKKCDPPTKLLVSACARPETLYIVIVTSS